MSTAETNIAMRFTRLFRRVAAVLRVDATGFREIAHARDALIPGLLLVVAGGLARGVFAAGQEGAAGMIGSPAVGIGVWLVGSALVWTVATKLFGATASYVAVLRTLGFATVPLLLLLLGALPLGVARTGVWVVAHGWTTLALIVAVREVFELTPRQALLAFALTLAFGLALFALLGTIVVEWGAFD